MWDFFILQPVDFYLIFAINMSTVYDKYEAVIGLEVHAQLSTKSKAYASDSAEFGAMPNTQVSVVTLGHPGTLPKVNKKVIEYAIKMGLATHCTINLRNEYARKNYFYADLPKGYQITQDTTPICTKGLVTIKLKDGQQKSIGITRIHMEEDAGKSMHDQDVYDSLIDLNRAGVALIEVVSEPDMRSSDEAHAYLTEIRKLVRYLDICDGNMEEGSLRCDANISVRLKGSTELGKRCEVKNLNSIRNVQRAIDYEIIRQIDVIEAGGHIDQNTLNFDAGTGKTSVMRSKEMANDYRYFPEPDLPPILLEPAQIEAIKQAMPALPEALHKKYVAELKLSEYDANILTDNKETALFFEELIKHTNNYKAAANWIMGSVRSYLNEQALEIKDLSLSAEQLAGLIALVDAGKINNSVAAQQVFPKLIARKGANAEAIAKELNLIIETNEAELEAFVDSALAMYPEKVAEYKAGKIGLLGLFMGEVMKISKGKLDPKTANRLVLKKLEHEG